MALGRLRICWKWTTRIPYAFFTESEISWLFFGNRNGFSSKSSESQLLEDAKDAPVYPHLRPPRKLRQVTSEDSISCQTEEAHVSSKRQKKKRILPPSDNRWSVVSYCTAEEYKLEQLKTHLQSWKNGIGKSRYQLADSFLTEELVEDAVHYKLTRQLGGEEETFTEKSLQDTEAGDIFIFAEGAAVFWNVPKEDAKLVLNTLKDFEIKPYSREIVEGEAEYLDYSYVNRPEADSDLENTTVKDSYQPKQLAKLRTDGRILLDLTQEAQTLSLVKYAFSDAIALSVKLATYETLLQEYVDSVENVVEDMKTRGTISLSQEQVMKKTGELFFLRHRINLGSHMLDSPDFYWDRDSLENLYRVMTVYLNIGRRTRIINEKLNHCDALVELLRGQLHNQHSVRLELMIIWLICIEVFFEFLHYFENWYRKEETPA